MGRVRSTRGLSRREALLGAATAFAAAACGDRAVQTASRAHRVVSTSPSMTEAVFAMGVGPALVGRSSFCDFPPEATAVEVVGGFADPNVERILALAPSLVIGERGPAGQAFVDRLASHSLSTWFPEMDTIAEIEAAITELGARLDATPRAAEIVADIERDLATIAPRERRPTAVLLFDWRPLVAAGSDTFPDELLRAAGADNVVKGVGKYPKLSTEGLLALDPDVVIDGSAGMYAEPLARIVASIPGLETLRAVREGRLRQLGGTAALRPGPRVGKGVQDLSKLLA